MADTARLNLPLISPEQAQKHITHNEAITALDALVQLVVEARDLTAPPAEPVAGQSFIIGNPASGDWTGRDGQLASWTDGGWRYAAPAEGWRLWDRASGGFFVFYEGTWAALSATLGALQNLAPLGINTSADANNRLAVRSNAVLMTALESDAGGTGDVRLVLNRETGADTASFVFQSGFSGRAEIGLAGNDDFTFKVSPDGTVFHQGMTIDKDNGFVTFNQLFGSAPSFPTVVGGVLHVATSYAIPAPESGTVDTIDTITGGFDGAVLILTGTFGNTLTFADGAGNLKLGAARALNNFEDSLMLLKRGSDWIELAFANNG